MDLLIKVTVQSVEIIYFVATTRVTILIPYPVSVLARL